MLADDDEKKKERITARSIINDHDGNGKALVPGVTDGTDVLAHLSIGVPPPSTMHIYFQYSVQNFE